MTGPGRDTPRATTGSIGSWSERGPALTKLLQSYAPNRAQHFSERLALASAERNIVIPRCYENPASGGITVVLEHQFSDNTRSEDTIAIDGLKELLPEEELYEITWSWGGAVSPD